MSVSETESLLRELVSFLAPSPRVDVRIEAAKAILMMSAADNLKVEDQQTKQAWDNIVIPQLVKWIGDQPQISKPCIEALTNLSAIALFSPTSPSIANKASFWRWLFEDISSSGPLLVNLTAHPQGPAKIDQHVIGGGGRACAELLAAASTSKSTTIREYCMSATRNLTLDESARMSFTSSSLALLCETMVKRESTVAMRRDAAGALRNLLLEKDQDMMSMFLDVDGAAILAAYLLLKIPKADLELKDDRNERDGISPILLKVFSGELNFPTMEHSEEVDDMVIECLLLCASTRVCRERMRKVQMYAALRNYHPYIMEDGECPNEEMSNKVYELVEFLISDEDDEEQADTAADAAFEVD